MERTMEIISLLLERHEPVTVHDLMGTFQVSERTIRYAVQQVKNRLSAYGIILQSKPGAGYYIEEYQKAQCRSLITGTKETKEKQNSSIVEKCFIELYQTEKAITLEQLIFHVSCSTGTLVKAIKEFNSSHADIQLETSHKGLKITGSEYAIRMLACKLGIGQDQKTMSECYKSIRKANKEFDVWMQGKEYQTLSSYCCAALKRPQDINTDFNKEYLSRDEKNYAEQLLQALGIKANDKELACMIHCLNDCGIILSQGSVISKEVQKNTEILVKRIQKGCQKEGLKINVKSLKKDIDMHLTQLAKYSVYHIQLIENPLLMTIKTTYQTCFEIADNACRNWKYYREYQLNESEISYIAIYIYRNLERAEERKIKAVVVCASGKGLSHMIALKISDYYPQIDLVGIESAYQIEKYKKDIDLIISTVPLENSHVPVVSVSPLLNETDLAHIVTFIQQAKDKHLDGKTHHANITETTGQMDRSILLQASNKYSVIMVWLMDLLNSLPSAYQLNADMTTALILHTNFAIPRWCRGEVNEDESSSIKNLESLKKENGEIYSLIIDFFKKVEESLGFPITASEKIALFEYIVRRK